MYLEPSFSTFLSGCGIFTTTKQFLICICGIHVQCISIKRPDEDVWCPPLSLFYSFETGLTLTRGLAGGRQVPGIPSSSTFSNTRVTGCVWPHMALNMNWFKLKSQQQPSKCSYSLSHFHNLELWFHLLSLVRNEMSFWVFLVPCEINHFFIGSKSIYMVKLFLSFVHF